MDDLTAIFVFASVVVAVLLVVGIAGVVIFARGSNTSPDFDLNQILTTLEERRRDKQ
ncbi:hypothetical protein [Paraburkholderia heleia]|uniref:hypothetical protein n=1 Tax=Paraburkholderia heleia TaxID=634127 RepID=UPI002AB60F47|nr:hypothetical protein [Paraburkholderia heleia]